MGEPWVLALMVGAWAKPAEILLSAAPITTHPLYAWTREDHLFGDLVHESLFEPDGYGSFRSDVVTAWSADNAIVTLTLAKRKWHDGRPLVAADVCATIERIRGTARPTPYTAAVNARIAGCTAEDPGGREVRVTLVAPMSEPRAALAIPLVPAHRADWAGAGPQSNLLPIGLGPYRAVPADGGWKLKSDGSTGIGKVLLTVVPDPADALARGRGVGVPFVDPISLGAIRAAPGVALDVVPARVVWALFVNQTRGPLADPAVREALDLLIDRDRLAAGAHGQDHQLPTQPWTAVSGPFLPRSSRVSAGVPVPSRDPEAARALLAGAGLVETDAGWTWQGQPWVPRVATPAGLGPDPGSFDLALTESFGFPVEVVPLSSTQWWFTLLAGGYAAATDLALVPIDPYDPGPSFHSRTASEGYHNPFGWSDPQTDALLTLLEDDEQGQALHGWLADVHPALFLWTLDGRAAWRTDFSPSLLERR